MTAAAPTSAVQTSLAWRISVFIRALSAVACWLITICAQAHR
jgi:hypothetical protein